MRQKSLRVVSTYLENLRFFEAIFPNDGDEDVEYFVRMNESSASRTPAMNVAGSQRAV